MNEAEQKRPTAGIPPWLLIALVLLVYRLPQTVDVLRADIHDFMYMEEAAQFELAVTKIEDVPELVSKDRIDIPSPDQMKDLLEKLEKSRQEGECRVRLRDWLMGGACARFRNRAAQALATTEQAKYLWEDQKATSRRVVESKKKLLALRWRSLMMTNCGS